MHTVIYKDGRTNEIPDYKAKTIELLKKQNMLNIRQSKWLASVREIVPVRKEPNHSVLIKTKDMICDCRQCTYLR